jgi:AcrR family transcriptional regulator
MPKKKLSPPPPARKPRADAQRNRERILEVAKESFTRDGAAASLDDIARRSGIGNGTLYRHFPTRDDPHRSRLPQRSRKARRSRAALRRCHAAARSPPRLDASLHRPRRRKNAHHSRHEHGRRRLPAAHRRLPLAHSHAFVASVKRAIASGDLRSDTDPNDFVRALVGIFHTTASPGWEPSARRLVDILIAGSRSTPILIRMGGPKAHGHSLTLAARGFTT